MCKQGLDLCAVPWGRILHPPRSIPPIPTRELYIRGLQMHPRQDVTKMADAASQTWAVRNSSRLLQCLLVTVAFVLTGCIFDTAGQNTGIVGFSGGSVVSDDGAASIQVEEGVLTQPAQITIRPATNQLRANTSNLGSKVYVFSPDSLVFARPVVISIALDKALIGGQKAVLAWRNDDLQWVIVPNSIVLDGRVEAKVTHFTEFAVLLISDNVCGDTNIVTNVPGTSCGECGDGTWTCNEDNSDVTCLGASQQNACGGCGVLAQAPNTSCGECGDGTWTCNEDNSDVTCLSASQQNACGGCQTLDIVPGAPCGPCSDGVWSCGVDSKSPYCDGASTASACACGPGNQQPPLSTPLLATRVISIGTAPQTIESIPITVKQAGDAMLRINNGAKLGDSNERVSEGRISLNDIAIVETDILNDSLDCHGVLLPLVAGANILKIELGNQPGARLSLQLSARADKITVPTIFNPATLEGISLRAKAIVTALGVPVEAAPVRFETQGGGSTSLVMQGTSSSQGIASAKISGFSEAEDGVLTASVDGTSLSATAPFQVVGEPAMTIEIDPGDLEHFVNVGAVTQFRFSIQVHELNFGPTTVDVQMLTPEPNGANVELSFPFGNDVTTAPSTVFVDAKITGATRGTYQSTLGFVLTGTKISAGITQRVSVREPLQLNPPLTVPSILNPSTTATAVTFRTLVTGTANPPEILFLDEVGSGGDVITSGVAELRDNGQDPDSTAGDGFYAATLDIFSPVETQKRYRLRADFLGKTVFSGVRIFSIVDIPGRARPSDPAQLATWPNSTNRFYANEVNIVATRSTSASRLRAIVEMIGTSLDETTKIVGSLPPIDVYLIEIEGDGTANGVQRAIDEFSTYDEIISATPNWQ